MSEGQHHEIESKFSFVGELPLRGLGDVADVAAVEPAGEQDLDAEYFDTPDLRLLEAGIALRRRTGGDAGWHLKLSRAPGDRVEVQRPLGRRRRVPTEFRDLVIVHTREAPLMPVARVRTHRVVHKLLDADGVAIAEVADDDVRATTASGQEQKWREVEVELVGTDDAGILASVSDVLTRAGAKPSEHGSKLERALGRAPVDASSGTGAPPRSASAGAVVARYLTEQAAAIVDADVAVRLDLDDAVHKMRVAVRRLRSTLATYRRLLDEQTAEGVRSELHWLGGVLGPVRDSEVIRGHLDAAVEGESAALPTEPARRRIDDSLGREHEEAHRRAVVEMSSARYLALIDALQSVDRCVADGGRARRPAKQELRKHVRRAHRRMRRAADAALAHDAPTDEHLHEVRKAAKRVRYAGESVSEVHGARAAKLAASMEGMQQTLGDHQDAVVIRQVIRRLADDAAAADENTFVYGRLDASEECRGERARADWLAGVNDGVLEPPRWLE